LAQTKPGQVRGKKEEGKLCSDIEEEKSADFDDGVI
jgi:hypothetical protein